MPNYISDQERQLYKNKLAQEMAHSYQGSANARGPVAEGISNYLSKFGPGYWEGVKGDIDSGMRRQLANAILTASTASPTVASSFGIEQPTSEQARTAMQDYYGSMPFGTESLGGAMAGMIAYHGSPHKFDKFSMSKIGTGEGAQAYGHGLYFAESPDVAKTYADVNSTSSLYIGKNKIDVDALPDIEKTAAKSIAAQGYQNAVKATREMRDNGADPKWMDTYETALKKYEKTPPRWVADNANLYKVDISDSAVKNFLDWDKPLSEQPESVRKALTPEAMGLKWKQYENYGGFVNDKNRPIGVMIKGATEEQARKHWLDALESSSTGADLYRRLGLSPEEGSKALLNAGIPGIRYLDQASRDTSQRWIAKHPKGGENTFNSQAELDSFIKKNPEYKAIAPKITSNFVVFDEDIVKILDKE